MCFNCRIKNFGSDVLIALGVCYPVYTYILTCGNACLQFESIISTIFSDYWSKGETQENVVDRNGGERSWGFPKKPLSSSFILIPYIYFPLHPCLFWLKIFWCFILRSTFLQLDLIFFFFFCKGINGCGSKWFFLVHQNMIFLVAVFV